MKFTRRLNPDADPQLLQLTWQLRRAARLVYQRSEDSLGSAGLSFAQYRILMHLLYSEQTEERDGLHPSQISDRHGTSRNTISALLRSLESAGLVRREQDKEDRRRFLICLTEEGRRLVRRHAKRHIDGVNAIFANLSRGEIDSLAEILQRLSQPADVRERS